jgi:hypothetical protein
VINIEEKSRENKKLVQELQAREFKARESGDLKEAQFLRRVKNRVYRGVAMTHGKCTQGICPCCHKPMDSKRDTYCQYCGQLVKGGEG